MNTHDDTARELHEAVRCYGESVQASDRLGAIRARTRRTTAADSRTEWWRGPWLLAGGAGVLAASVIAAAVLAAGDPALDNPVAGASDDPSSKSASSGSKRMAYTGYYLTITGGEPADHLVGQKILATNTGEPGLDAVRAMLKTRPTDPDYISGFDLRKRESDPVTDVNSVTESDGVITVDLTEDVWDPYPNVTFNFDPSGTVVIQQLVWTVQDALDSDAPVAFTVNGEPARGIWFEPTPRPVQADPDALEPILIDYPTDGSTVQFSRRITVSGTSDTYEGNVAWEVYKNNRLVREGSTIGGTMGERATFRFDVQLSPGTYTIRAYAESAEDGSLVAEDTKAITVK